MVALVAIGKGESMSTLSTTMQDVITGTTGTTLPDINDLSLLSEPIAGLDPNLDPEAFFRVPLPDDGPHVVVLMAGNDGVSHKTRVAKDANGNPRNEMYVTAHLCGKVSDPTDPANGLVLFDRPTSIAMRGGSRLHAAMALAGCVIDPRLSVIEVENTVKVGLSQGLTVVMVSQWQASAKAQTQEEADSASAAKYKKDCKVGDYYTFLKGQRSFPEVTNADGTKRHDPEVTNPITGEKVNAQAQVVSYKRVSAHS